MYVLDILSVFSNLNNSIVWIFITSEHKNLQAKYFILKKWEHIIML